jgi:hypothetical protein
MLHSFSVAKESAEPPLAYPSAPPDSERAKQPPLPDFPYKRIGKPAPRDAP